MEIKVNSELKYLVDSIDGKESIPDEEVYIQDNQPQDGKIWIDTSELSNLGTEVVDSVNGKQTNKAPSVRAVVQDLVSILYPVGSIYMSTNATNPKDLFGIGEWEQIKDTFLMSAGTTYRAGTTGGAASHTHSYAHTHGVPGVAHTHTSAAHTHTINGHTHTSAAHTHSINGHTHTTGSHSLTIAELPSHNHKSTTDLGCNGLVLYWDNKQSGENFYGAQWQSGSFKSSGAFALNNLYTSSTGSGTAHSHGNTGSTSLTTNSTTPGATGSTSLTTNSTTPGATGSTTPSSTTTNSQSTSTSGSTSNLPPYLAVYTWKRVS